jgi:hypothetical protein
VCLVVFVCVFVWLVGWLVGWLLIVGGCLFARLLVRGMSVCIVCILRGERRGVG